MRGLWYRVISIVSFIALWEIIALLVARPHILPTPVSVAIALKTLLVSPGPPGAEWAGELLGNTVISLVRVVSGFLLAALTGVVLGIIMGWWRKARNLIEPVVEVIRPIPPLAWIPLALLWFGLGFKPAVFLIWLGAFFPVLLSTITGLKSTPKTLLEAALTLGAKQRHLLIKVVIPSATPSIITGLKVGLGIGWMCLVAAELTGSNSGLGFMINYYYWTMEPANTVAGMLMIGLVGVLLLILLNVAEKRLLFWREGLYESKS